ncbi:MAG: hypothetical protein U5L01_11435 [Rheinheimera sp.]|nr:hypothetical protein [Rheinheimera sp.]
MSFIHWLLQERPRQVLMELDYDDGGTVRTYYLSNGAFVSGPTDTPANMPYDPYLVGGIEFERSLGEVFTGLSVSKVSDVSVIANADTLPLLSLAVYGRAIRVYLGDPSWVKSQFVQIITGICDGVLPEQTTLKIKFRDTADRFLTPLLTEQVSAGVSSGQLKPLCLGRCFNIKPILLDDATHTYLFNSTPSQAVSAVRFNGAAVPGSYYSVDLAASTITFNVYPQGDVTMDVDGTVATSWLSTATTFIQWIATRMGLSADVVGLPSYQLGLYVTSNISVYAVLDEICASVGAYWYFDRVGQFAVRVFNGFGAPASELTRDQTVSQSRKPRRIINPLYEIKAVYKRNWTPLSSIAGSVHENTPAFAKELASEGKELTLSQPIKALETSPGGTHRK